MSAKRWFWPMVVALALSVGRPAGAGNEGPRKLAVVVGISKYDKAATGYSPLNTDGDIAAITGALQRQGFKKPDVKLVRDQDATREGIVSAIETHLVAQAKPGDVVVIHYSGHGHQISDDDGDEIDGYDEVLVPYGAPAKMEGGYDGSKHLRDDDFGELIGKLRAKVGPAGNVLVTIDACHSGTITRGADDGLAVRGGMAPMGGPGKKKASDVADAGGMFEAGGGASSAGLAPFVVISAARHDEVARETRDPDGHAIGALSLAFSETMAQSKKGMTYRQLFGRIQTHMSATVPKQSPQLEGDIDTMLLSGDVIDQAPYFQVTEVKDGAVRIDGGRLVGVNPGTKVAFHPEGTATPDPTKAIAVGTVTKANEVMAEIAVEGADAAKVKDAQVFVTEYSYGELKVKVAVDPKLSGAAKDAAGKALAAAPIAEVVTDQADLLVIADEQAKGKLQIVAADGTVVVGGLDPAGSTFAATVGERVKGYGRGRYLKGLELHDETVDVTIELVPAKHTYDDFDGSCTGSSPVDASPYQTAGHGWTFQPGDGYLIKFKNNGDQRAYVAVLDLMPDGTIEALYPQRGYKGNENYLEPGAEFLVKDLCFEVTEPYGTEMLKLFATRERVDFEPILTPGATRGAGGGPFEALMVDTMSGTRSAPRPVPKGTGSTYSLMIEVVEKRE